MKNLPLIEVVEIEEIEILPLIEVVEIETIEILAVNK